MRRARYLLSAVLCALAAAACDRADEGRTIDPHDRITSRSRLGAVECLRPKGFAVRSARVPRPSADEPEAVLTLRRGRDAAEVAFSEHTRKAKRLAPKLRGNAKRFHGVAYRLHRAVIVWFRPPSKTGRRAVDDCLVQPPPSESD